jgi:hypothetical protein
MSNDKSFKVTGVSRCGGNFKVRFANDMARVKVLIKTGHDEIELVEMPAAGSKSDCVNFLKASALMERAEFRSAIEAADVKYNGATTVKVKAAKPAKAKAKPSLEAIKARAVDTSKTETAE